MHTVGLFEAKTHLSEYVALAEAGGEVVIMRHKKPVAKLVALNAKPALAKPKKIPKFVQRTFNMGAPLLDLTNANALLDEMDVMEFLKLDARLQKEAAERRAASTVPVKPKSAPSKPVPAKRNTKKVVRREAA